MLDFVSLQSSNTKFLFASILEIMDTLADDAEGSSDDDYVDFEAEE